LPRDRQPVGVRVGIFVLITCEHGGNRTPAPFDAVFRERQWLLSTHRGYDPGALEMGRALARAAGADFVSATVSRLVVELNRPVDHPAFYSSVMQRAPESLRRLARQRFFDPYMRRIDARIAAARRRGEPILHIGSHSFTPVKSGVVRNADIGLLYDPRRTWEREFCRRWREAMLALAPHWVVRFNYPYHGYSAGLTTDLRKRMPAHEYAGIELEINQKRVRAGLESWARTRTIVAKSLRRMLPTAQ
jgi:predicted N-formylglutamate amidohydrolase